MGWRRRHRQGRDRVNEPGVPQKPPRLDPASRNLKLRLPSRIGTDLVMPPTRLPAHLRGALAAPVLTFVLLSAPAVSQTRETASTPEMRELVEAAKATAQATREGVDYARVTPDLLTQILAKLDKIEDKLDRVETALKRDAGPKRAR